MTTPTIQQALDALRTATEQLTAAIEAKALEYPGAHPWMEPHMILNSVWRRTNTENDYIRILSVNIRDGEIRNVGVTSDIHPKSRNNPFLIETTWGPAQRDITFAALMQNYVRVPISEIPHDVPKPEDVKLWAPLGSAWVRKEDRQLSIVHSINKSLKKITVRYSTTQSSSYALIEMTIDDFKRLYEPAAGALPPHVRAGADLRDHRRPPGAGGLLHLWRDVQRCPSRRGHRRRQERVRGERVKLYHRLRRAIAYRTGIDDFEQLRRVVMRATLCRWRGHRFNLRVMHGHLCSRCRWFRHL